MPDKNGSPPFSCIFLLRGKLHGSVAQVQTWIPSERNTAISGTLTIQGAKVSIILQEDQGGCSMTGDSMVASAGDAFWSDTQAEAGRGWLGVGMVRQDRAVLFHVPQQTQQKRPYLVQFDPVVILERKPGWVRVAYLQGTTPQKGWLQSQALYSMQQP